MSVEGVKCINPLRSPIGEVRHGECWAEAMSLAQFRRQPVEFVV
jgi:hypothetical protein